MKNKGATNKWLTVILVAMIAILAVEIGINAAILSTLTSTETQTQPSTQPFGQGNVTATIPEDYVAVNVTVEPSTVHFTADCRQISMDILDSQAYAIETGLTNYVSFRPLTHDIMRDILEYFGMQLQQARVDRYDNETYFATLVLRQGDTMLSMDSRPSDATALAVRFGVPVLFKKGLLEKYGEKVC